MNFLREVFRKLSSDRHTDSIEIINHAASWVLKKQLLSSVAAVFGSLGENCNTVVSSQMTVLPTGIFMIVVNTTVNLSVLQNNYAVSH